MVSLFTRISVVTVAAAFFVLALFSNGVVSSTTLGSPEGRVLLTVSGAISARNMGNEAHLDQSLLEHIGTKTIETTTIWTDGVQKFRGTPLSAIVQALGVESGMLRVIAVNDYSIQIPVEEALANNALVAFERNGKPMSVREKGPLWIVYPYDSTAKYKTEV
ncbi:MAG: molybdopterin-dependent oxidoreductase, partial [Primorskyibacter sp.]